MFKNKAPAEVFYYELCEIFKNICFVECLRVVASGGAVFQATSQWALLNESIFWIIFIKNFKKYSTLFPACLPVQNLLSPNDINQTFFWSFSPASQSYHPHVKTGVFSTLQTGSSKIEQRTLPKVVIKSIDIITLNVAMMTRSLVFVWMSCSGLHMFMVFS